MIDDLPTGRVAVYIFLEMIALGFALEAVAAFMRGDVWWKWCGGLLLGIIFMVLGVASGRIITKVSNLIDWRLFGKRIHVALRVLLVVAWISIAFAGYYEWKKLKSDWHSLSLAFKGRSIAEPQSATPPVSPPDATPKVHHKRLNWHEKQNWRQHLHTGMTRTDVRELFGEPQQMAVFGTSEFWDYGYGEIDFEMRNHPDGSLYSWIEPTE
jgi:hypothetical protein